MMLAAKHAVSFRVLVVSEDSDICQLLKETLTTSGIESVMPNIMGEEIASNEGAPNPGPWSWCGATSFITGCDLLHQGLQTGYPFSVVIMEIGHASEDDLGRMMEEIWGVDPDIRIVLGVSGGQRVQIPVGVKHKAGQWAILRKPCFEEDVYQLLSCLCGWPKDSRADTAEEEIGRGDASYSSSGGSGDGGLKDKEVELELARGELASSKFFVENILHSMADSLFVITMDMSIGSVNPSLLNLLGYQEDELLGESPGLIFGEGFAQGAIMEALMMQGSVSGVESSFVTKEGREIPISVSGSLIQDEQGQFQGMVCVAQDITERKRMEEEKRQLHEQLLDTSRQLGMAEVASGVLHNVGNVLNSVNVSVGVMMDLVKHTLVGDVERISQLLDKHQGDLGHFISQHPKGKQIPGYLQRLSGQLVNENRQMLEELGRLKGHVGRAQQCVAAQQDLAKPSHITEPFWLSEVVEEAVVLNEDDIQERQIAIIREFDELPQVVFDRHQILQVVVSLIRNACQAMYATAKRRLVLRIKQIPGPPDSVRLEVEDSGVGIRQEDLTRIFGQGYSPTGEGRGSSLHNGALVAKNLGGALTAQSGGLGHGATLVLDLPGEFHFPDF